ncbi:MAG: iron-containing alcohol dehydrogenase [Rhodoferax sp.]|uniref:iron-containing alcohol dehydrogenase n=1 Tax=Rhodoferax sp. TaxID=50421 RepID=UPI0026022D31|nr:iron-containing alcohol dehydrogenase [Rhodoferax sp.]MDD2880777.1 iron-containing alcohol dehydrogenase [Rhodoferax sp.]
MFANQLTSMARSMGLSAVMRTAGVLTRLLPISQPTLMVGPGASARLGQAINDFCHHKVLIVTDAAITQLGLTAPLTQALSAGGTRFVVFDAITADAPVEQIEQGVAFFNAEGCDAIVAVGGGSAMDAAKTMALAVANHKHPRELVGYFKGWRAPMPLYAVPTTAGTGSEVTVVAVVSDPAHHRKLVIADTRLVPRMAALDPNLMLGLPADITAATGMDALTHAIEAYIGHWGTDFTDRMALSAVGMIYEALPVAYVNGQDVAAREKMALAANYAGQAFTRANVGYVHAIAHQLGGLYHTPHGLANAIMLPHVLRFLSPAITAKLAALARHAKVGKKNDSEAVLAQKFLDSVVAMNARLGIPATLEALREKDISALAHAACHEADVNYPVPRYMSQADCEAVIRLVLPKGSKPKPRVRKKAA